MNDKPWMTRLSGDWAGTVRTWLDPEAAPVENEIKGSFRSLLDGPSVLHEYTSRVGNDRSDGLMLLGKDIGSGELCLTWVDTFHTGGSVMPFRAAGDATFYGSYAAGPDVLWHWRVTFDTVNPNELTIAHTNITPTGEEAHAIEVRYRRV